MIKILTIIAKTLRMVPKNIPVTYSGLATIFEELSKFLTEKGNEIKAPVSKINPE